MRYLAYFFLTVLSCSCSHPEKAAIRGQQVTDDLGRQIGIPDSAVRILPLAPSVTEMLYAIVPEDRIVARTQNDSFPVSVLKKPVFNNYPVDFEKLIALKPDLAVVKEGLLPPASIERIEELGVPVYIQKYDSVEQVISGLRVLGTLLKVPEQATKRADSLQKTLDFFKQIEHRHRKPSVLLLISSEPIYVYGKNTYASSMLKYAGVRNAIDRIFESPFPAIRREYLLQIDPDIIIGHDAEKLFTLYPELKEGKAYRNHRLYEVDDDLISRPGPRLVEGIAEIRKRLLQQP